MVAGLGVPTAIDGEGGISFETDVVVVKTAGSAISIGLEAVDDSKRVAVAESRRSLRVGSISGRRMADEGVAGAFGASGLASSGVPLGGGSSRGPTGSGVDSLGGRLTTGRAAGSGSSPEPGSLLRLLLNRLSRLLLLEPDLARLRRMFRFARLDSVGSPNPIEPGGGLPILLPSSSVGLADVADEVAGDGELALALALAALALRLRNKGKCDPERDLDRGIPDDCYAGLRQAWRGSI